MRVASFYIQSTFIFQGIVGIFASVMLMSRCPEDAFNACLAPVIEQVTASNSAFPYFNDHQLDSLCNACDGLKPCFDKVDMRLCDRLELLYIEGVKQSCNYYCVEGPDYRRHRSCFNSSELQYEGSRCNYTLHRQQAKLASLDIENGGVRGKPTREDIALWCESVSEFISCMKDAVVQHCSEKAGEWVMNINLQYYHPIMESMECKTGSKVGVAVIFGVAVGLFVTMMVVIVTSVVCRRKQRNNSNNMSSTKNSSKNQNEKENGNEIHDKLIQDGGKNNVINLKQYYPEGESLLSSETSNCHISANEASTRHTDVTNNSESDVINSLEDKDELQQQQQQQPQQQQKRLLISEV